MWWYWKLTHRPFTFECFINKAIKIEPCPISYIWSRVGWRPDLSWGTGDEHVLLTWWENREGRGTTEWIYAWKQCHMCEWMTVTVPDPTITAQGPATASAHVSSGIYSDTYKRNPLGCILINENGTFRYNTSAEHEGHARTIHTSGLKCKNKQKRIKKYWTFTIYRRGVFLRAGWSLCPGFTHAVETCQAKGLYTAVPDATKSYSHTLLIIIDFFFFLLFGKIKKLGAASTNTDKPTKVTHRIMNLVRFCTDAHSLHQFILSCCHGNATPTGKGGEQKGEEFPLFT